MIVKQQSMRTKHCNEDPDLGWVHLNDATGFVSTGKEAKLGHVSKKGN